MISVMLPLAAGYTQEECLEEICRENFWLIGKTGYYIFYGLAVVAIIVLLYGVYKRFSRYAEGEEDKSVRLNDIPGRVKEAVRIVGSNEKQFYQDLYAGVMHTFIMWGFLGLLIATTILAIDEQVVRRVTGDSFWVGDFWLSYQFAADSVGLLFIAGVSLALYKRYVQRDERLWHKHTRKEFDGPREILSALEDDIFVWTLFLLGVGGYLLTALRIVGTEFPEFASVSYISWAIALAISGVVSAEGAQTLYPIAWWSHALLALGFVAWIPYAKPFHMISSFANVVTRDEDAKRRLHGVDPDLGPEEIGYKSIEDFSWKHLLDHDACTKCGRCTSVCPANASGRNLSPRDVILDLKQYREELEKNGQEEMPIVSREEESVIDPESMDACMSCTACMDACPVEIEHVPQFTEMNRRLTESGQMDESIQEAMMNIFQNGNSFGDPERKRPEWTEELDFEVPDAREEDVEYLWYVGDYPSYDERNQKVARSMAAILEESDVSYGILYEDEQNDGNDVRRVGEEGLYEMLAEDNISAFEDAGFEKVVCTDPHSYNTFKNEYDQFGWEGDGRVYHYTQVIEELVENDELDLNGDELDYTVTYHDPCHLGRFNEEYEAPRDIVRATGCDLNEMPRNRSNSFCCGGGGGGLWADIEEEEKPSEERLREALEDTDAGSAVEKFVVACPMCMTMYEDGRKTGGYEEDLEIVDINELLVEAIEAKDRAKLAADGGEETDR